MRAYLRKPKWLAYLLLLIILAQVLPPAVRYYFGSREWIVHRSSEYGFAIAHPGNWVVETYRGWFRGQEGVVAIIGDSPGLFEAERLLVIYHRPMENPSLSSAAKWGQALAEEVGGHRFAALKPVSIGIGQLPALEQELLYDENQAGLNAYLASSEAEYVLAFRYRNGDGSSAELFRRMLTSFELGDP